MTEEVREYHDIVSKQQIRGKICQDDFELMSIIGVGAYGKVILVKKKDTGKIFAMKVLKKSQISKLKQANNTMRERKILEKVKHPFIVELKYAF